MEINSAAKSIAAHIRQRHQPASNQLKSQASLSFIKTLARPIRPDIALRSKISPRIRSPDGALQYRESGLMQLSRRWMFDYDAPMFLLKWVAAVVLFAQLPIPLFWFVLHPQVNFWRQRRKAAYITGLLLSWPPVTALLVLASHRDTVPEIVYRLPGKLFSVLVLIIFEGMDFLARETRSRRHSASRTDGALWWRRTRSQRNLCADSPSTAFARSYQFSAPV